MSTSLLCLISLCSCIDPGGPASGLALTDPSPGPTIRFDLDAKPLPEVPFPNDLATWVDPSSPTGLRVNISLFAPTSLERQARERAQDLSGFGTYAPIWVSFDRAIHPGKVRALHGDDEMSDDAVYVVNVDPKSSRYGEFTLVDLGQGFFPVVLEERNAYFRADPRGQTSNLLFETHAEDLDNDGILDPGEDTDGDGVLDAPNVWPDGSDPVDGLLTFYERETNTLMIRLQTPLAPKATHAVVLTKRITGIHGEPIRSPFPYVNHARQTDALAPLAELLPRVGSSLADIAFAWTFTTQDLTGDLEALRAGLYGHGPFKDLSVRYPAALSSLHELRIDNAGPAASRHALPMDRVAPMLGQLAGPAMGANPEEVAAFTDTMRFIDYTISGTYLSPNLLVDRDGIAGPNHPADENEAWQVDPSRPDQLVEGPGRVTFLCAIPKETQEFTAPFPVSLISHGYGSTRLEMLVFAGSLNRFGIAACAIDAVGHGLVLDDPDDLELATNAMQTFGLNGLFSAILDGRARDLNGDGMPDSGGDFWTADVFHTRDMVRQTALDMMSFVRILRSFNGETRSWCQDSAGVSCPELSPQAGDFNGDGRVDFGGDSEIHVAGGSLGGIMSGVLAGIEPALTAAAPIAGGAGLTDIGVRSSQKGVPEAVIMRMMGPMIVLGQANDVGERELGFLVPEVADIRYLPFATLDAADAEPGWDLLEVEVQHSHSGETEWRSVTIPRDGAATRVHFPADADTISERAHRLGLDPQPSADQPPPSVPPGILLGDRLIVRVRDPLTREESGIKRTIDSFERSVTFMGARWPAGAPLVAPAEGLGHRRGTPSLRRFFSLAGAILESGDPVAYAPHHISDPLKADYDPAAEPGTNMLYIPTIGDMSVPINTGIAMARAGGALSHGEHRVLVETYVVEGLEHLKRWTNSAGEGVLLDPDNLSGGEDGFDVPRLEPPLRASALNPESQRFAAMRIPYMKPTGQHGFGSPAPGKDFDIDSYMINAIGGFFRSGGTRLIDNPCLEDSSCESLPGAPE